MQELVTTKTCAKLKINIDRIFDFEEIFKLQVHALNQNKVINHCKDQTTQTQYTENVINQNLTIESMCSTYL